MTNEEDADMYVIYILLKNSQNLSNYTTEWCV